MRDRKSVDSTLGFTALDGLCMGTRPGGLDPGVVLYLFQKLRLSVQEVERVLYRQSGLLGISGTSSDMRDLLQSAEPAAQLAVDYFVYRAAREIGGLAAVLGGVDALVFTAGIGENAPEIRRHDLGGIRVARRRPRRRCQPRQAEAQISRVGSPVSAWMIPTNEELVIARHTGVLLGLVEARTSARRPSIELGRRGGLQRKAHRLRYWCDRTRVANWPRISKRLRQFGVATD